MSAASKFVDTLTALVDERVSVALVARDRADYRRKISDTAAEIQRQVARGLCDPPLGGFVVLDEGHQSGGDLDVLIHGLAKSVQDLVERLESLGFGIHESSPVRSRPEGATSDVPAMTVQEEGGVPVVTRAGVCDCAAPAKSSKKGSMS